MHINMLNDSKPLFYEYDVFCVFFANGCILKRHIILLYTSGRIIDCCVQDNQKKDTKSYDFAKMSIFKADSSLFCHISESRTFHFIVCVKQGFPK